MYLIFFQKNGCGVMRWNNGDRYAGIWKDDKVFFLFRVYPSSPSLGRSVSKNSSNVE
jgi:hypothetical protein